MTIRQPSNNQGPNRSAKSTFCSNSSTMSISLEAGYHKNGDNQPSYACPTSRSSSQMLGKGNQRPALTKRTSSRLQRNAGQLHTGWLPLLPLNEPSLNTESGRHLTRPGRDGEPLQINKARFKDLRAVGAFLDSELPEFDPGMSLATLMTSADCHIWVVQPCSVICTGWSPSCLPQHRDEADQMDTPLPTPPEEHDSISWSKGNKTSAKSNPFLDPTKPILGCIIVRLIQSRPSSFHKPECESGGPSPPKVLLHVMALAVHSEHRRLGIAEWLVDRAVQQAKTRSKQVFQLQTRQHTILSAYTNDTTINPPSKDGVYNSTVKNSAAAAAHRPYLALLSASTSDPIIIKIKAEGISRPIFCMDELQKDDSSMLFWKKMGLDVWPTKMGGRRGWAGQGVKTFSVIQD